MLAEIFLLRIETLLRSEAPSRTTTSSDTRFVPIALPRETGATAMTGPEWSVAPSPGAIDPAYH